MALTAHAEAGTSNLPPLGKYIAQVKPAELMEEQDNPFKSGYKQQQVKLPLQIKQVFSVDFEDDEEAAEEFVGQDAWAYANFINITPDGQRQMVFTPNSKLRIWCQSIAGRPIEDGEEFDFSEIEGKFAMLSVVLNKNGNPKVDDVSGYRPKRRKRKASPAPEPEPEDDFEGELLDDDDEDEFEDFD